MLGLFRQLRTCNVSVVASGVSFMLADKLFSSKAVWIGLGSPKLMYFWKMDCWKCIWVSWCVLYYKFVVFIRFSAICCIYEHFFNYLGGKMFLFLKSENMFSIFLVQFKGWYAVYRIEETELICAISKKLICFLFFL